VSQLEQLLAFGVVISAVLLFGLTVAFARHDRATCRVCQQRQELEMRRHENQAMWVARKDKL
jgi:uncharacterized membrane protein